MDFDFYEIYKEFSTTDLLKIVHRPDGYRPEAVNAANRRLAEREIAPDYYRPSEMANPISTGTRLAIQLDADPGVDRDGDGYSSLRGSLSDFSEYRCNSTPIPFT
jgi:hypothetical protein